MDITRKHCDVYQPPFWETIHTLRVTETNGLGSETTYGRFRLHELCKINFLTKHIFSYFSEKYLYCNCTSMKHIRDAFLSLMDNQLCHLSLVSIAPHSL